MTRRVSMEAILATRFQSSASFLSDYIFSSNTTCTIYSVTCVSRKPASFDGNMLHLDKSLPTGKLGSDPLSQYFRKFRYKINGTEYFENFVSKIPVNISRLSFFPKLWKYRKFSVSFGIPSSNRSARQPAPVLG